MLKPPTLAWIAAAAALFGACSPQAPEESRTFKVLLQSADAVVVNFFGPNEDFPCCQLQPGTTRMVTMKMRKGDARNFRVGKNNAFVADRDCRVSDGAWEQKGNREDYLMVVWDGVELNCSGW